MDICKYRELHINEILSILNDKKICNMASVSNNKINVTPMLYTFNYDNDKFIFYLININDDPNLSNLKNDDTVSLFLESYVLGFYINAYKNMTAHGKIKLLTDNDDKNKILLQFKDKHSLNSICSKNSKLSYIKVIVDDISGRQY